MAKKEDVQNKGGHWKSNILSSIKPKNYSLAWCFFNIL